MVPPLLSFPVILLSTLAVAFAATPEPGDIQHVTDALTIEAIFSADQYEAEEPGATQWLTAENAYSAVAYVRDANLYVENMEGGIRKLTERNSDAILNGIMSWAYEEEFSIRDGFRCSPDGA